MQQFSEGRCLYFRKTLLLFSVCPSHYLAGTSKPANSECEMFRCTSAPSKKSSLSFGTMYSCSFTAPAEIMILSPVSAITFPALTLSFVLTPFFDFAISFQSMEESISVMPVSGQNAISRLDNRVTRHKRKKRIFNQCNLLVKKYGTKYRDIPCN